MAAPTLPPRYLTTEEVADYLRTSASTVRYWKFAGRGPQVTKVGRRNLYDVAHVEQWLAQQATDPAA